MSHRVLALPLLALFAALLLAPAPPALAATDDAPPAVAAELLSDIEFRSIGPLRGGRSTAVTGIHGDHRTFFMGTTGGGVWVTRDAGLSWGNISDGFLDVASIGAIDVADSDPNVIWLGTGSACVRGNASTGNGMYRSLDGGRTWTHAGLADSGAIAKVVVHPRDPDTAWAAAFGHPFGPSEQRGVFRTEDGGATWEHVLYVSDEVGAVDLSINPDNPRHLYAAMWRFERKPWTFYDASEDGGIFRSTDGGSTWKELEGGLPTGITGRIGVSVSPADPDRVYALVSAPDPDGGLWRSDNAGDSWRRINRDRNLRQRHWYYSHVKADPADPDTVYIMNVNIWRSVDGGESVERLRPNHGDTHDLWIDNDDPTVMILGADGGGEVSLNAGATWSSVLNQPTAEIYRVTVDEQFPYRVYGSQQDNSTLSMNSQGRGGQQDWYTVGGCESGHIAIDPRNPDIVYAGCYIGEISRFDRATGERRPISAYPVLVDGVAPRELEHRFQWNAPILISRHDPTVLFHTSNTVNISRDEGRTWQVISPDLTYDNEEQQELPGAPLQHDHTSVEVYGTVFSLAESPHDVGEIWAGSDDGRVHVTRDGGDTWQDVTPADLPVDGTVNTIDVSAHRAGKVTIAVQRYRMDDWTPYAWQTTDGGESWRRIADGDNGIPGHHPIRTVREDPDAEGLLYAGTEFGLFVSFDDGGAWQPLQGNLPVTPVTDLVVHRQDLVLSTQGRGFWILDDLTPLHAIAAGAADSDTALLLPRAAIRASGSGSRPAALHYRLPEGAEATLTISDAAGNELLSWSTGGRGGLATGDGIQQQIWDLRLPGAELTDDALIYLGYSGGPVVVPGSYAARLTVGDRVLEQPFEVLPDPRRDDVSATDLAEGHRFSVATQDLLQRTHDTIGTLRQIREQTEAIASRAEANKAEVAGDLRERADLMAGALTAIEDVLIQTRAEARQDPINFPPMLDTQIGYLYRYVAFTYGRPGQPAYDRFTDLETLVVAQEQALQALIDNEVSGFNEAVRAAGVGGILIQ
jgi:photosystem II stability/assembly factor-like uncharacterized protein